MKRLLNLDYNIRRKLLQKERGMVSSIISESLEKGSIGLCNAWRFELFLRNSDMVVLDMDSRGKAYFSTLGQSETDFLGQTGLDAHFNVNTGLNEILDIKRQTLKAYAEVRCRYLKGFGFEGDSLEMISRLIDENHMKNIDAIKEKEVIRWEGNAGNMRGLVDGLAKRMQNKDKGGCSGHIRIAELLSDSDGNPWYQAIFQKHCSIAELKEIGDSYVFSHHEAIKLREKEDRIKEAPTPSPGTMVFLITIFIKA